MFIANVYIQRQWSMLKGQYAQDFGNAASFKQTSTVHKIISMNVSDNYFFRRHIPVHAVLEFIYICG